MNAALLQVEESLKGLRDAINANAGIPENLGSQGAHVLPVAKATLLRLVEIVLEQIAAAPDIALPTNVLADVGVLKGEIDVAVTALVPQLATAQIGYAAPALVSFLLSIPARLKPVLAWTEVVAADKMPSSLAKRTREMAGRLDSVDRDAQALANKRSHAQSVITSVEGVVAAAKTIVEDLEKLNEQSKVSAEAVKASAENASQNLEKSSTALKRVEEIGIALALAAEKTSSLAAGVEEASKVVTGLVGKVGGQAESVATAETRIVTAAAEGTKAREKLSVETEEIAKIIAQITQHGADIEAKKSQVDVVSEKVKTTTEETLRAKNDAGNFSKEAQKLAEKAQEAYRIVSTAGLSGAFHQRAERLTQISLLWLFALGAALTIAAVMGGERSLEISKLLASGTASPGTLAVQLVLSGLTVGAPIWMAWLSTKQVSYLFRLAEDYGYKAAVAKAYEGFRDEAAKFDPQFSARLFATTLQRMDENPLRYVSESQPGSPVQELIQQPFFQEFMRDHPSFLNQLLAYWKRTPASAVQASEVAVVPKVEPVKAG